MTNVSFADAVGTDKPAKADKKNPSTALAVKEAAPLAPPAAYTHTDSAEGEITKEDVAMPRLNIVAKVGELSNLFKPGNFVLNKLHDLGSGPLLVSAVYVRKYYREVTDFDDTEVRPRTFTTSAEVAAAGLRVGTPSSRLIGEEAAPEAAVLFFIEAPEGLSPEGVDAFDIVLPSGKKGTFAMYTAAKTSYKGVASQLFTALIQNKSVKEKGLASQLWKFSAPLQKWESKTWFQGSLQPGGRLEDADVEYLKEFGLN